MKIWTFGVAVATLMASPAVATSAEITVRQYAEMAGKDPALASVIWAAGESYAWANAALVRKGQPELYCQPPKLPIGTDQYVLILKNYVNSNRERMEGFKIDMMPYVMLGALQEVFPCNK